MPRPPKKRQLRPDRPTLAPASIEVVPLPAAGFLRQAQILGNPKAKPPIPAILPVSPSAWWRGIREKRFPKPVKLGERAVGWRVEDIRALIASLSAGT